jgi:hypothetical protein
MAGLANLHCSEFGDRLSTPGLLEAAESGGPVAAEADRSAVEILDRLSI